MLPEQGRIITTSDGSISEAEVLEHGRRMNRDPRIEPGFSELLDLSNLESGDISLGGIKAVVELERGADRIERSRLAIVAPRDVAFGIGRMYQSYAENTRPRVRVFRLRDEALAWLDSEHENT